MKDGKGKNCTVSLLCISKQEVSGHKNSTTVFQTPNLIQVLTIESLPCGGSLLVAALGMGQMVTIVQRPGQRVPQKTGFRV